MKNPRPATKRTAIGHHKTRQPAPPPAGTFFPFESPALDGPEQKPNLRLLVAAACVAIGAASLLPRQARAADECGPPVAGAVTCTGDTYATGINYVDSTGLTLNLNNPAMTVTAPNGVVVPPSGDDAVSITGAAGNTGDLVINASNFTLVTSPSATENWGLVVRNSRDGDGIIRFGGGAITTRGTSVSATNPSGSGDQLVIMTGGQVTSTHPLLFSVAGLDAVAGGASGSATVVMSGGSVHVESNSTAAAVIRTTVGAGSTAASTVILSGGTVSGNATSGVSASHMGLGQATVTMTGGSVTLTSTRGNAAGLVASVANAASTATALVEMHGGTVEMSTTAAAGTSAGIRSQTTGTGQAVVKMSAGAVTASGGDSDGIRATSTGGTYAVEVSGGTVSGGGVNGATIHTAAAGGGTLAIGAGATINAGVSGVAIRDGDLNRDGVDEIGGNAVITTAGTVNGAIVLGGGTDSLTVTGGTINGSITGDGADALNFDLGTNSFTLGAAHALSGMDSVTMMSGTAQIDSTIAANTLNVRGGTLLLTNTATIAGATTVDGGTLAVNGTLNGAVNVLGTGRLRGTGSVGDTTNAAGGTIAPGNSIGTLLVAGNYVGSGGTLEIEGVFAGTGSPADRLVITGNASGTTTIRTIDTGGTGALTGFGNTDGISIVQVGGASTADAFALAGGYAAAGPYQYQLRMFDAASSAVGEADPLLGAVPFHDYRLQSVVDASGRPVAVPQIAGYQAMPTGAVRYGASLLESLHKRQGELRDVAASSGRNSEQRDPAFFARANGSRNDVAGHHASGYDQNIGYIQAGGHVLGREMEDGATLRIGGAFSHGQSKLEAAASSARVDLRGTTFALISTYQTAAGWYLDGVAQLTDFDASIQTRERGRVGSPDGLGLGLSVEGGYPIDIGAGLVIEPQAQLSYQKIKFDRFVDVDGIAVDLKGGESLRGRVGGRIKKAFNANTSRQWTLYAEGNLVHEFLKDSGVQTSGVTFASDSLGTSAQLGGGIQAQLGANTAVFASVSYSKGLSKSAADAWSGNVGVRVAF